ncbi:MAG: DUF2993 domain-containing protein [Microbacteriaceae bacterium]
MRRRLLRPLAALIVLLVVAVAAIELGGRQALAGLAAGELATALDTDADDVSVEVGGGSLVAQLLGGSLTEVSVTADDARLGDVTGALAATATGVPLDSSRASEGLDATLTLAPATLESLVRQLSAFADATVSLGEGTATVTTSASLLGVGVDVAVTFTVEAEDGAIALTPAAVSVGGASLDLDALRSSAYATLLDTVAAAQSLCVAEQLPASLALREVAVSADGVAVRVTGSNVVLAELQDAERGSC